MAEEKEKEEEKVEVAEAPEAKAEEKAESKPETKEEAKEVVVPTKFKKIVEEIEKMSVLELNELVKIFEDKFGVSASATQVAGPANTDQAEEEKSTASVELADSGTNKIAIIKIVKEVLGLGLKEAKDLVDAAPSMLKADMKKEEAEAFKTQIDEAGGKATLK